MIVGAAYEQSTTTAIIHGSDLSGANNLGSGNGAAYVYRRNVSGVWSFEAYLKAPNSHADANFGLVSIDGDVAAIGAYGEKSTTNSIIHGADLSSTNILGVGYGAAYIFRRTGSTWAFEAYLKAQNAEASDFFGWPIAISGDTVIVTAQNEDGGTTAVINGNDLSAADNGKSESGAVYVFRRTSGTWDLEAYLKPTNAHNDMSLGTGEIEISGDVALICADAEKSSTTAVINGTDLSSTNATGVNVGAGYIFRRSGVTWTQEAYLKAPNAADGDQFCTDGAIRGDKVIIGTIAENSSWAMEAYIKSPNNDDGDNFGRVALMEDGTYVISARNEDSDTTAIINGSNLSSTNDSGTDTGAFYIFK